MAAYCRYFISLFTLIITEAQTAVGFKTHTQTRTRTLTFVPHRLHEIYIMDEDGLKYSSLCATAICHDDHFIAACIWARGSLCCADRTGRMIEHQSVCRRCERF